MTMKLLVALIVSLSCFATHAQENEPAEQTPTLREMLADSPRATFAPKKKVQAQTQPIRKGAYYLLTYQADDNQWYEEESVATGRWAKFCDGVRYEVDTGDFTYFAKVKQLRRIYQ